MQFKVLVDGVEEYVSDIEDVAAVDVIQDFGDKRVAGRMDHNGLSVLVVSVETGSKQPEEVESSELPGQTSIV